MKRHCNSLASPPHQTIAMACWLPLLLGIQSQLCARWYWDVFLIYFLHNVLRKFAIDNLLFGTPFISCCLMYSFSQFLGCPGSMPGYCDCGVPKRCFILNIDISVITRHLKSQCYKNLVKIMIYHCCFFSEGTTLH